jgi:hypothetical protein
MSVSTVATKTIGTLTNAAFNIAQRGLGILVGFAKDSVSLGGALLVTPYSGGQELAYA